MSPAVVERNAFAAGGQSTSVKERYKMAVVPGRPTRMCLDIFAFILCIAVMVIQLGVLDYYFITHMKETVWYSWIAGDVLVLIVMILLLFKAVRYNQRCMEENCAADANVKYAFFAWLVYSLLLAGKVAVTFRFFYDDLDEAAEDTPFGYFDKHCFRLTLALSAIVFLLLLEAHHYTQLHSQRQLYLTYLATNVTLDLLDSIFFLDLLWLNKEHNWDLPLELEIIIVSFGCINLVLPTFALLKLRYRKTPRWMRCLPYQKLYTFFYVFLANVPFLAMRVYLCVTIHQQDGKQYELSLFSIKNLIMLYLIIREVWTRIQSRRMIKSAGDHEDGRLTAAVDDE